MATKLASERPKSKAFGWKTGLVTSLFFPSLVLLINVVFAIIISRSGLQDYSTIIYEGKCATTQRINILAHIAINVLSIALLSSCNYFMQVLNAPTREEVDRAHSRWIWLDIRVPSIRNLKYISRWKGILWTVLLLTSIPIHFFYNSIIYSGTAFNQYAVVSATQSFLDSVELNATELDWQALQSNYQDNSTLTQKLVAGMQEKAKNGKLLRMSNLDCILAYAQQVQSNYGSLLLIVNDQNSTSNSRPYPADDLYGTAPDPYGWICGGKNTTLPNAFMKPPADGGPCQGTKFDRVRANASEWSPFGEKVSYCLSESAADQCQLYGNFLLLLVVVATNTIEILALTIIILRSGSSPLLTIGDALSSFLEFPDDTTRDMCLASSHHFRLLNYEKKEWSALLTGWLPKKRYWCSTVRVGRWVSALGFPSLIIVIFFSLVMTGRSYGESISINHSGVDFASMVRYPGAIQGSGGIVFHTFVSNIPQIVLSFVYFTYNGLFTSIFEDLEWHSYSLRSKSLRVSSQPKGLQRPSHFLQLPYRISLPLIAISGVVHWLVSQAVYMYSTAQLSTNGTLDPTDSEIITCGFSMGAMVAIICVEFLLMVIAVLVGYQKLKDTAQPIVGSCSAAMSAACHPPKDVKIEGLSESRLKWGVVSVDKENEIGHCGFSNEEVAPVEPGYLYSGRRFRGKERKLRQKVT
ncbi:hypothetical protein N431DRAFT_396271 [Stipitochalara longipes BDJ]|nr:hypothetical protein N431DRAFT_396271 [Stipitochalara longipes BDJ]